ncbi:transcription initiation factor IIE, beta subunit, partial [Pleomassaria siparia CBS 279.74]
AAMSSLLKTSTANRIGAPSPTPSNSSVGAAKRKRTDDVTPATVVYSQPQETGTGNHVYTQLTYTIEHLRNTQKWMTFKEIMDYLNIQEHEHQTRAQLQVLYRSQNPANRVEYNPRTDTYRYKPKYDIRSTAELQGWLQTQKSAQGLSVKDLKDGWSNVQDDIKKLEDKQQILVKRNHKDSQAKTVWFNDPSLMHKMDDEFKHQWHGILLPANPDDLRNKLIGAGLKPSSAPREAISTKGKEKKRKTVRHSGKQTNNHMQNILKDFSYMRK